MNIILKIIGLFVLIIFAGYVMTANSKPTVNPGYNYMANKVAAAKAKAEIAAQQEKKKAKHLTDLEPACKFSTKIHRPTEKTILGIGLHRINRCAIVINEVNGIPNLTSEEQATLAQAKRNLKTHQIKALPIYRDQYGPILREIGVDNFSARTHGKKCTTITHTAYQFISNKAIKIMYEILYETYQQMRFKRVQFRKSKYDEEYTYYTLDTPDDSKLAVYDETTNTWTDLD